MNQDHRELIELANAKIPFGRFAGRYLVNLPEEYLLWFAREGFPAGKLGLQLQQMLEIKQNGLESLIHPLIRPRAGLDS